MRTVVYRRPDNLMGLPRWASQACVHVEPPEEWRDLFVDLMIEPEQHHTPPRGARAVFPGHHERQLPDLAAPNWVVGTARPVQLLPLWAFDEHQLVYLVSELVG